MFELFKNPPYTNDRNKSTSMKLYVEFYICLFIAIVFERFNIK